MSNITKLYLLNVPLEADYKHTLFFDSKSKQEDYFKSKSVGTQYNDFSYQRKDNKIRIPKQFDEINGKVNYVMYQNTAYNNKWFYAFITNIQYVSDGVTDVFIKTDVIQTWFFDYEVKSCFVEREHTKDDTIGKNTLPEGLETGEYICNKALHDNSMDATCYIVASTVDLETGEDSGIHIYNNVVNGWYYYYFDSQTELEEKLNDLETLRTNDAIVSIFIMPSYYVYRGENNRVIENFVVKSVGWAGLSQSSDGSHLTIYKPKKVNGYTPKNNKLLTYPYTYLLMDNNAGASAVYHYELFNMGYEGYTQDDLFEICSFNMYGAITPGGSIKLVPIRYNGEPECNRYSLTGGKFPVCGWQSDYYTNWLTQNALNIEVQTESIQLATNRQVFNDLTSPLTSLNTSSIGSMAVSGALGVGNALANFAFDIKDYQNQIKGITAQKEIHAFQSPTVRGNVNSGDVDFVRGNIRFSAYQMSIKEEYAKIIDNYFSMYGYQTNRVKTPNKNHRSRYWYTKTVGCDIAGAIPNEDTQIIKACYDNGITFWKNPNDVGVYTDSNNELIANTII